ncbi:CDP-diacylglycerol--glycerol-3-phosphate 3-phosphatidyltransferase, mitochondrial [Episyrphus balteatus]|uniref:CDP-diacylglycerol--glycerol-3-phosphate 3-phosphatidyltransferase, mitochondrial n=1 Tax=Episyrphus balteatus TaxID=286459 RepID=UPI0024865A64|nr:CDP-diacylglycerol--glycerol-3-phosphate 3-phosphatidyltransferase, mitochondrial [Episyrphus balteatus]XP_055852797.1 CDP-diacylglycerol--glycerol-3-phosphate 3-phosphatidyltransferase, mitochondrial [Episyrphus balteatus]
MFRRFFATFVDQQITAASSPDFIFNTPKIAQTFNSPGLESLSWLYSHTPCFPLRGDQISIIHEPSKFYDTLIQKSAEAKDRIVLASLYLGTGNLEANFVQTIKTNLQKNDSLRVNVLLDFTRGTRGEVNSKTMLMPLLTEFNRNVSLSMYHTPDLRGMTKRFAPPRWNELLGLQHMKIYLFDNSVMISGANLSNDYFTNRQDRYILIEDKNLADFYAKLISKVQEFSLLVREDAEVELHKNWSVLPYEGDKETFMNTAKQRVADFFQDTFSKQKTILEESSDADTWIFPLIEMGQIGIHHDSIVTKQLFSSSVSGSRLKLATGYFNLTQEYMDTITKNCLAQCSILMAHPNANGFQGANGPAGSIPAAYTLIAKHFYESLVREQQDHRVNFFEFEKDGWSYHAKGLWYYLPNATYPSLTLIGSSNFGERSVNRDLESQVCLVTSNKSLQSRLQEEADRLYSLGSTAENEITTRPVPRWVQAVVKIFRNFF